LPGRRISWEAGSWAGSGLALAAVASAIAAGWSWRGLWPAAAFLVLWFAVASANLVAKHAARRRADRLQTAAVVRGVRLRQPIWIRALEPMPFYAMGAGFGALAALIGFPGAGLGVLLTFAAMGSVMFLPFLADPDLTFEDGGLRVHQREFEFFVPWVSILDVSAEKTPGRWFTNVRVAGPGEIVASVSPNDERTRSRVWTALALGTPRGQALRFSEWTAGLDAITLARTLEEARGAGAPAVN
jgi:hypothetical protein